MEPVRIVSAAGGEFSGLTSLQNTAFLLELAGLGDGYGFAYGRFGPDSEEFTEDLELARLRGHLDVERRRTDWGGEYSIFRLKGDPAPFSDERERNAYQRLVGVAVRASAVDLDLVATVACLSGTYRDPWKEAKRRKSKTAINGGLERARELYEEFRQLKLPEALPEIPHTF